MTSILFDEYESDVISVKDFDLKWQGALITHIAKNDNNQVTFWSGDPEDKFSQEILIDKDAAKVYLSVIERDYLGYDNCDYLL